MLLPCLVVVSALGFVIYAAVRLYYIHRSLDEISEAFSERITDITDTPIGISGNDRHLERFVACMNGHIEQFCKERRRFRQGDEALKEVITNVSHDLRTPLTVICGYLNLLRDEPVSDNARRYLDMIENRSSVMCQLLEELLEYSIHASVRELPKERVSLKRAMEENLLVYYEELTGKGIVPEVCMGTNVERYLNLSALNRILSNILSNTIKYSDGDLAVELDEEGVITFSNRAASLDSITAGRLLDRFFTLDTGSASSGIGLSEVKLLTEQMGGKIRVWHQGGRLFIRLSFPEE